MKIDSSRRPTKRTKVLLAEIKSNGIRVQTIERNNDLRSHPCIRVSTTITVLQHGDRPTSKAFHGAVFRK